MTKFLTDVEKGNTSAVLRALDGNKSLCTASNPRTQKTGLHLAAQGGHDEVVQALLKAGASHDATDGQGNIPLHLACEAGHTAVVELLVGRGRKLSVKATNKDSRTPLHLAAMGGHAGAAKLLLAAGAATQVKDKNDKTPLDLAPSQSSFRAVLASSLPATASPGNSNRPSATGGAPATSAASAAGGAASGLSRDPSIPSSPASRPPWDNSFAGQAPDPALVQDQAPGQAPTLDHGQAPVTYIPPTGPFAANFTQSRDTVPHSVLTEILKPLPSQPSTRGYDILSGASNEQPSYMQPLRRSTQDSTGTPGKRSATRSSSGATLSTGDKDQLLDEQAAQIAQLQGQVQTALAMLHQERAAHDETRQSALTNEDLAMLHRATSSVDDVGDIHKSTQWEELQEQLGAIRESVQLKATEHGTSNVAVAGSFEQDGKSTGSAEDGTSLKALSAKLEQMEEAMRTMKLKPPGEDAQGSSLSDDRHAPSSYDTASRADRITEVDESEERDSSPHVDSQPQRQQATGPSRVLSPASSLSSIPRSQAQGTRTDDTEVTDMSEDLTLVEGRGGIGRGGVPTKGPLDKAARSGSRSRDANAVPEDDKEKPEVSSGPVGTVKDTKDKQGCGCVIS